MEILNNKPILVDIIENGKQINSISNLNEFVSYSKEQNIQPASSSSLSNEFYIYNSKNYGEVIIYGNPHGNNYNIISDSCVLVKLTDNVSILKYYDQSNQTVFINDYYPQPVYTEEFCNNFDITTTSEDLKFFDFIQENYGNTIYYNSSFENLINSIESKITESYTNSLNKQMVLITNIQEINASETPRTIQKEVYYSTSSSDSDKKLLNTYETITTQYFNENYVIIGAISNE